MESVISASGLTKYYGNMLAVDHISFEVKAGEIFGFLGPNGAGKTTTIRMLTGLAQPSEGSGRILGYDIGNDLIRAKKVFGVVPETSNLYEELSAVDNLVFMAQLYGVPKNERRNRAEQLLHLFGLQEKRYLRFAAFSKGMKRALTVAAALIHGPEVLFLDEPTVGLDAMATRQLRTLIRRLSEQGITVFLTTHNLEEADMLCHRLAIVVQGEIVVTDTPENLKAMVQEEGASIELSLSSMPPGEALYELQKDGRVARVVKRGDKLRLYGGEVSGILNTALRFAESHGLTIVSVSTIKPSLEDAFVRLTGLSSEVMLAEKDGGRDGNKG
ncbi:MAG: daunorubicin ABC transporter ATP-binding protein [Chloroflexi bacterium RBG_13_54_9]|nr:MAG: daunorubicin ABC transporter ATP-binding protein [Chloroflexi bacterium RBG_13_54_9]